MKTSEQWYQLIKNVIKIHDPDGWRYDDAPSWDSDFITKEEFTKRLMECTINFGAVREHGGFDKFLAERLV